MYLHIRKRHVLCCHGNNRFSSFVYTCTCTMSVTMQAVEHTKGLLVSTYATLSEVVVRYKTHSCCRLQSIPPYSCPQDWESDWDSGAMPLPPGPSQSHLPLPRLTSPVDPHHVPTSANIPERDPDSIHLQPALALPTNYSTRLRIQGKRQLVYELSRRLSSGAVAQQL